MENVEKNMGGESVYRQFLPYCTRAHITKVYHTFDADRFFPNLDEDKAWKITDTSDLKQQGELTYQYITYERTDHDGECI